MAKKDYFTRHKAWDECLQAADGCYYTAACKEPAIGAHVVSQAWLRTLASQGKVYWFTRHKGLPKGMSEALKKGADESTLFQRLRESQPSLEPIGRATRAKFCCEQHDRVFNSIDSRDNMDLQDPDDHHLNLMFHRALLRQLHVDTAAKIWRGQDSEMDAMWASLPIVDGDSVDNLQQPRRVLQQALGAKQGGSWCVRHLVRHIPGQPRIAAALAASWRPAEGKVTVADLKCTGAWGCTVIPHDRGHLVAYHYCTTLPKGPRAKRDLAWKENYLLTEVIKDGPDLPFRISQDLLELCEELCIAPSAWNAYPNSTQKAIQDLFLDSTGVEGTPWTPPREGINLFA
jgi:hypothetical protein